MRANFNFNDFESIMKTMKEEKSNVPAPTKVSFEENKHLFKKIAWDMWHLSDEPKTKVWFLDKAEDGTDYLCRGGDWEEPEVAEIVTQEWSADSNKENTLVTLQYKKVLINKFAASDFGFDSDNISSFKKALLEMVSDKAKVTQLLGTLSEDYRTLFLNKFPELK